MRTENILFRVIAVVNNGFPTDALCPNFVLEREFTLCSQNCAAYYDYETLKDLGLSWAG